MRNGTGMLTAGKIELIDKNELIEALMREDFVREERGKVIDIVDRQPIVAVAKHRYDIEVYV